MADVENRQLELVTNPLDHRHDIAAPRRVERRERLVHQQDLGGGEQRAADRDALRLAARQALRPAPQKMANAQKLRRFVEAHPAVRRQRRSEEHTSELQSLMRISYAVFCLKKKKTKNNYTKYYA